MRMTMTPNYDRVAAFYDAASRAFSFGDIRRSKLVQLVNLKRGDRVLYLGAGGAEEAVRAALLGVDVTCIDISAGMIRRATRRFARKGAAGEFITGDVMAHDRFGHYDAVVGNYFFNVFGAAEMPIFLTHAVRLVRPGGRLMIADVAPPTGSRAAQYFNRAYSGLAMGLFRIGGLVAWHPTYDYSERFADLGLVEEARHDFRLLGRGPVMFRTLIGRLETA